MTTLLEFIERFAIDVYSDNDGKRVFHGSGSAGMLLPHELARDLPPGFSEHEGWSDWPFRVVWLNDATKHSITYCEGDVTVVYCDTRERWEREMRESAAYYAKYARYP